MRFNMALTVRDKDWIRQSFMVSRDKVTAATARTRTFTPASFKFTDTRLGGNFAINNPPGYTDYADIVTSGKYLDLVGRTSSGGMGRFYSEQIDDNSDLIHFRFGVAQFTGMISFFTGFFDGQAAYTARTGRSPGFFYRLGQLGAFVVALPWWPYIVGAAAIGRVSKFLLGIPSSKYYYLKPTPHMYWNRVNLIANTLAVNMRLIPQTYPQNSDYDFINSDSFSPVQDDPTPKELGQGATRVPNADQIAAAHKVAPDIWKEGGGIDVYQVANRAQRLANKQRFYLNKQFEEATDIEDLLARIDKYRNEVTVVGDDLVGLTVTDGENKYTGTKALIFKATSEGGEGYQGTVAAGESLDSLVERSTRPEFIKNKETGWLESKFNEFAKSITESQAGEAVLADLYDGSQFVSFRVDYAGAVSESFSNSTKESEISSKINGMSSSARSARFSFSDGETGLAFLDSITGAVRDVVSGGLDMLNISGIAGLFGTSFVDIPKQWDSSSADFPTSDFTIELRSPYGHEMSRFQNLMVPLSCLLAGVLPLSTGKQSFTSPFLCEMYHRGRNQIRLGIIESMSITRGVGNVGFTPDGKPLGIDVTFSVMDLSSVLHAPAGNFGLGDALDPINSIFADDSAFNDYMATLSSLSMTDQIYQWRKMHLNLTRYLTQVDSYFSVSNWTSKFGDTFPARAVSGFFQVGAVEKSSI